MVFKSSRLLIAGCGVAFALAGCTNTANIEVTHLTIVTTESSLDHASALAVAEYLTDQGTEVQVEQHAAPDDVYATLEIDTASDHAMIGVVTVDQDPTAEEAPLRVPDSVEILAQAPAELGLVPTASTVTAARFAQHQEEEDDEPLAPACAQQTWLHAHTPEYEMQATVAALADSGCEPTFETQSTTDSDSYVDMVERLTIEHDTVALLYGVDPVITDQGFATLDVVTEQWPHSNVVAVSGTELDDSLTDHVAAVLDVLESDSATNLLRGYHNAQASSSDLEYDQDTAIRYWLATHGLLDHDAVTDISTDND